MSRFLRRRNNKLEREPSSNLLQKGYDVEIIVNSPEISRVFGDEHMKEIIDVVRGGASKAEVLATLTRLGVAIDQPKTMIDFAREGDKFPSHRSDINVAMLENSGTKSLLLFNTPERQALGMRPVEIGAIYLSGKKTTHR